MKIPNANRTKTCSAHSYRLEAIKLRDFHCIYEMCVSVCRRKILDICPSTSYFFTKFVSCPPLVCLQEDCLFIVIFYVRRGSHYDFLKKVIIFTACTRLTKMNSSIMIVSQNRFSEFSVHAFCIVAFSFGRFPGDSF